MTAGSAVLLVALTMIAGRLLPASEYGKFSFAIALATIVETLMDIGLGPVTVRTVARDGAGAGTLFRHVLGLKIAWVALGLVALLIAAPILRSDPTVIRACYLMGISSAIRSYVLSARGLLQGLNRFDLEARDRRRRSRAAAGARHAGAGRRLRAVRAVASPSSSRAC